MVEEKYVEPVFETTEDNFQLYLRQDQVIRAQNLSLMNLEFLGRGGNGSVFRMMIQEGPLRGLIVAAKFLEAIHDPSRVKRFTTEVEILEKLDHPNVIKIYDSGEFSSKQSKIPFYVMAYQPRNLQRELDNHPRGLHPDSIMPISLQMASALAALHDAEIVHRDLKPSNVLFDGTNVQLADFGIARTDPEDVIEDGAGTPFGDRVGPRFYMSPEQYKWWKAEIESKPTFKSDVYQFGLILYQMICGVNPNTVHEWQDGHRKEAVTKLRRLDGSLVNDLVLLVRRMIDPDPDNRPDVIELQERLMGIFMSYSSHYSALYGVRPGREF